MSSRQDCWWQVRTWDKDRESIRMERTGILEYGTAETRRMESTMDRRSLAGRRSITQAGASGYRVNRQSQKNLPPPAPMLRKSFVINKEIASARAYVTGLGFFEFYVNGQKVSEDVLVPNLTAYGKRPGLENNYISVADNFREYRVMYLSYDIKKLLKKGENAIGAILGNGFYNAPINWTQSYGSPRFLGQIYITYTDGSEDIIISDQSWKASKSPICNGSCI